MENLGEYSVIYALYVTEPFHQEDAQIDLLNLSLRITFITVLL